MAESTAPIDGQARRFDPNPNVSWYRSPIDPETLSELMTRSDFRGWIQTLLHLGLFFATAALAYFTYLQITPSTWYWSVPLLLIVLFLHGTIGPFMGLIAIHELQHRTVFKTRWLNDSSSGFMLLSVGPTISGIRRATQFTIARHVTKSMTARCSSLSGFPFDDGGSG